MRAHNRFAIAGCIAAFMLGAPAQAHDRDCNGIVLNGCLNTADFQGGAGRGEEDYVVGGGGYVVSGVFAPSHAFAHAHAFAAAFARSGGVHGGHGGGMHERSGGGHR